MSEGDCPPCPECGEPCRRGHLTKLPHGPTKDGFVRAPHRHVNRIKKEGSGKVQPVAHVWFDD